MRSFFQELMHIHEMLTGSFCASRRDFLKAMAVMPFALHGRLTALQFHVAIVHDESAPDVLRGARMGFGEVTRAAKLLGFDTQATVHFSSEELTEVSGVVGAVKDPARLEGLSAPVINTVMAPAGDHIWHVSGIEWDSKGEKFGAAQLNARYDAAYSRPMTTDAWAGWFAMKVLWEAAARSRSVEAKAIQQYLQSPSATFDGHVGRPLRFDPETHRLV
jgi:hypothetical protein